MKIGLDFDNTLAGYDALFADLAVEEGLVPDLPVWPPITKSALRNRLRGAEGGEQEWQRLQAIAYGPRMDGATLMPGAGEFLRRCKAQGIEVAVVSHKTQFAAHIGVRDDLREAALAWMTGHGFLDDFGMTRADVHFEDDRAAKVARIGRLGLTHFVDDLEEVLRHVDFPASVQRLLFDPAGVARPGPFSTFRTWNDISESCFGHELVE